jgi:arylformamidase
MWTVDATFDLENRHAVPNDMSQAMMTMDMQFEYVHGQGRAGFPDLLADYQRRSDRVSTSVGAVLDRGYGPHQRQRFDHFPASAPAIGVLVYLHAGYWQSRDKSQFRFLAPFFQQRGFHVMVVNYPLCPEVSLAELVAAVLPCVPAIRQALAPSGLATLPLVVAGHSAGAHLAVELTMAGRDSDSAVQGVWGISGVYNPAPLLQTTLNEKLQLDPLSALHADVTQRVRGQLVPGLWTVGGAETGAFQQQNARMHDAWALAGNSSSALVVPQADHFTVLQACIQPDGGVDRAFQAWWSQVLQNFRTSGH